MVKRELFMTRITCDGDFTRMEFTMIDAPRYPGKVSTCTLPFEQKKHLLSSRPDDLGEADAVGHASRRDRKHRGRRKGGSRKGSR